MVIPGLAVGPLLGMGGQHLQALAAQAGVQVCIRPRSTFARDEDRAMELVGDVEAVSTASGMVITRIAELGQQTRRGSGKAALASAAGQPSCETGADGGCGAAFPTEGGASADSHVAVRSR